MALRLVGSHIVHLAESTYMWVQLTEFAIDPTQDDRFLIASLIESPGYAHDYASPYGLKTSVTEPAIHGRWWRSEMKAELFEPATAPTARALLEAWANDQDWADPGFVQPPKVQLRLEHVSELLGSGALYMLANPGKQSEHDYGWIVGSMGFHEFVVIDRANGKVHVVVASDD